ncbi:glycosyltransferase family 25 protein [Porticoccaceae bacterium]|jgi:glycosyl transferase family 25|nr:glycosyltransferase family 25 protein [Porticoccaceae bacterium]
MSLPQVFVINLDKSTDRMAKISKRLGELDIPFERISAVYGADLSQEEIDKYYCPELNKKNYRRPLGLGEIGCYISHIRAWKTIVDRKLSCALILEDDIMIDEGLGQLIKAISKSSNSFDVVKLYSKNNTPKLLDSMPFGEKHRLCRFKKIPIGNQGQLVSLSGATNLLNTYEKFGRPVDEDIQHWWEADINVLGFLPSIVCPIKSAKSDIDEQGKRKGATTFMGFVKNIIRRATFFFFLNTKRKKQPLPKVNML